MAASNEKARILAKLAAVRAAIAAGIDIERNRQRERYLLERLRQLNAKETN